MKGTGKKILLTGGTGFLGSRLARRLLSDGHSVTLLKRTTSNLQRIQDISSQMKMFDIGRCDLAEVFAGNGFDSVIHCATHYGRGNTDPLAVIEANLLLPVRLLMQAISSKVPMFLNTDTILDKRISDYSLSKKQFLDWMQKNSDQITCVNVALEHFFGPGDDPSKFVSFVIRQILSDVASIPLTPGEQKRDFIYIDDVVNAFATVVSNAHTFPKGMKKIEVGTGEKMRVRDFVELVRTTAGNQKTKLEFGALPYRDNEVMDTFVQLEDLLKLGWKPQISVAEGLRRTIEFERKAGG